VTDSAVIPAASVIIPTYNRREELGKTLETLIEQDIAPGSFEVIVADDGSTDRSADVVSLFAGRLRLKYCFQEDQGFRVGAARNAGARLAAAPLLIFLDCGTLAGPGLVSGHLAAHAGSEERRAVIGYCYGYNPTDEDPWVPDSFHALSPAELFRRYGGDRRFADTRERDYARIGSDPMKWPLPWLYFFGMNCSVPAGDFWAAGGFDERFRSWGVEDVELGYRLHRNGAAMVLSREAWTIEMPAERSVKALLYCLMRNGRLFLDKFREPDIELLADGYLGTRLGTAMSESDALHRWAREAGALEVRAEIEAAAAGLGGDARLAVFGCGPSVPDWLPPAVLADFDATLLARALADGKHAGHHAIGLRTPLPSNSADVVIVTSRLGGLWDTHGEQIMHEAGRVGRRVVLASRP
jgi:glycosyltransferase involved in cell wall biosynthesis